MLPSSSSSLPERSVPAMNAQSPIDPLASFVKVHDLWFDDGNLILQAEQSVFKIYRGLLCARSTVFADMFAFPPPQEGNGVVEGCPFVNTYDSAQDMTYFLRALLDSHFFEAPPAPTEIPVLAGVLRLATKYDVHHLRLRAMKHLLTTYPSTLEAWHARDAHRTIPGVENTPFVVLNLAREFDMPWLIPPVAYCISSHDLHKTLDGAEWPLSKSCQGFEEVEPKFTEESSDDGSEVEPRCRAIVRLTSADQKMCIKGRHNLLIKQNKIALSLAKPLRPTPSATPSVVGTPGAATPNPNPNNVPITFHNAAANNAIPVLAPPPAQAPGNVPAPQPQPQGAPQANVNPNVAPQAVPAVTLTQAAAALHGLNLPEPGATTPECPTPAQCTFMRFRCAEMLTRWGTAGILDFYNEQLAAFSPGFCPSCLEVFRIDCERSARDMWNALPGLFGLDSWEELERIKELSMR